jgi:hypothetical protein
MAITLRTTAPETDAESAPPITAPRPGPGRAATCRKTNCPCAPLLARH